jgi:transposase
VEPVAAFNQRRKTDIKDAEWMADLIRHGRVKPSFVPPPEIRELRDLVRHRRSARRLAAWAGACPANHESAGRAKRRGTRKGNVFLKATLMTAAMGAARTKGTDLRDKFHRLKARLGAKKAALAIAHKILVAVFHRLARTVGFHELGADYLDRRHKHRSARRLIRRLDALEYTVMLQPKPAA